MKRFVFLILAVGFVQSVYAQSPCAVLSTQAAIVVCEQQRAGGAAAMHESAPNHQTVTLTVLRQIAASLNAGGFPGGPFGVLKKDGGAQCAGYACDIICAGNGATQRQWDVFGDVGGASTPDWSGPLDPIVVRPCEFVAGVPPSPGPPVPAPQPVPPAVDLTPILARLDALEHENAALKAEDARLRALIVAVPASIVFPLYRGSLFGIGITSKPCPSCK
jgi:hypothetical protein